MNVEQSVLQRVRPSDEEDKRLREAVSSVMEILNKTIKKKKFKAQPILVGSVAKGTHLKNPDVDVFVSFPAETSREKLEKQGLQLGQFLKNKKKMFAEHPYTRGSHKGIDFEVVPCYEVASPDQKMSAVDRSPYHTKYVLSKLRTDQRDEVRLLKAFMKGIGVYGAEAKVQGFSGYLCELLVLKYGSFHQALEATEKWQAGNIIALDLLPTKIFDEPLIVVDPVDPGRNVASAVSKKKMAMMIHASIEYLKKPRIEFFFPKSPPRASKHRFRNLLKTRGTRLMVITIRTPNVTEDILYPQVRKALKSFEDLFTRHSFFTIRSAFDVVGQDTVFMFEFEVFELPKLKKHGGPPVWVKNALDFQAKWQDSKEALGSPYIEGGNWFVDINRNLLSPPRLVTRKLKDLSLGKDLDRIARKSMHLLVDEKAMKPTLLHSLQRFLEPTFPWEN